MEISIYILSLATILISVGTSFYCVMLNIGQGSDHFVHVHLIDYSRKIGHRLFNHFPNLLNPTPLAYPLFLHNVLSRFSRSVISRVSIVMNPLVLLLLQIATMAFTSTSTPEVHPTHVLLIGAVFALTPQLYSHTNARNFGLSARALGFLLVFLVIAVSFSLEQRFTTLSYGLAVILVYLSIGTSIFALQTLILFSTISLLVFGSYALFVSLLGGLLSFIILHPKYGRSYLREIFNYWRLYSSVLAERFILLHRKSIWLDFFGGFLAPFKNSKRAGVEYFISNPIITVLYSNPLSVLCVWIYLFQDKSEFTPLTTYSLKIAIVGLISLFLISFRRTRFLGEPERYVEMATPFATIGAISWIIQLSGLSLPILIVAGFAFISFLQIWLFTVKPARKRKPTTLDLAKESVQVIDSVMKNANGSQIRFISNSGHWSKTLLNVDWEFLYIWPTSFDIAGEDIRTVMPEYPNLSGPAVDRFLDRFRITYLLWDKTIGSAEDYQKVLMKFSTLLDHPSYTLFRTTHAN